ncbi:MAG: isoprenylcysteine carboxylmethyltransferase family protein [Pseudomonadota bacterium]
MISRIFLMLYSVLAYAASMASLVYMALWLVGVVVPNPLDGPAIGPLWQSLLINLVLVLVFALQHSVMARPSFKAWWTRVVSPAVERSTYVLFSTLALMTLMVFWRPLGGTVWELTGTAELVMLGVYAGGWALLVSATFLINHFDLFGLRQAWINLRGNAYTELPFVVRGYYHVIRHPIYAGWMVLIWAAPHMTISHLVFAVATTLYMVAAIRWEEHDLKEVLPEYDDYARQVPAFAPDGRRFRESGSTPAELH